LFCSCPDLILFYSKQTAAEDARIPKILLAVVPRMFRGSI
jgi:hypothetical protein